MEFIRRLAVEKERRNNNTAAAPRVSQSVGRSLSTDQTNHHNDKTQHSQRALVRPAASGSVKEKVVLQTTRTSTYRTRLMPEKSAIESMMPQARSPEAKKGGEVCNERERRLKR